MGIQHSEINQTDYSFMYICKIFRESKIFTLGYSPLEIEPD